jgi:hypothetical protein
MDKMNEAAGTKNNNPKPAQTAQKETNMKNTQAYRNVQKIKKMIKGEDAWNIAPEDKALLDTIAKTPLAELISTEEGKKTLQKMGQVIRLTKRGEKDGKSVQLQKDFDMWSNPEWATVLESVDCIVALQLPNAKKKKYIDFKDLDVEEHGDYVVVDEAGMPKGKGGIVLPKIGGYNFKTGQVEHAHDTIIVPYGEVFHMWHDVSAKRPSKKRTSKGSTKAATGMSMLESATKDLEAATKRGDKPAIARLTKTVEFLQKRMNA